MSAAHQTYSHRDEQPVVSPVPPVAWGAPGTRTQLLVVQVCASDVSSIDGVLEQVRLALTQGAGAAVAVLGDLVVDFAQRRIAAPGRTVHLTAREFEILEYLAQRSHGTVSRDELLRALWGYADLPFTRLVDNAVARLRKKIEPEPRLPRFLHTIRGDGYCLTPSAGVLGRKAPPEVSDSGSFRDAHHYAGSAPAALAMRSA